MAKPQKELSDAAIDMIATRFSVLAEPMRLKLIKALGNSELNVTELIAATGSGQANVSKHLGIMWKAGLLTRRKDGLMTFYRVSDARVFDLLDTVVASLGDFLAAQHVALKKAGK